MSDLSSSPRRTSPRHLSVSGGSGTGRGIASSTAVASRRGVASTDSGADDSNKPR